MPYANGKGLKMDRKVEEQIGNSGYEFRARGDVDPVALLDNVSLGLHHHMAPPDQDPITPPEQDPLEKPTA